MIPRRVTVYTEKIYLSATTEQPQSARSAARARWITRFCSVLLITLGTWSAATGTAPSTLIALFSISAGLYCWRYQRRMRGAARTRHRGSRPAEQHSAAHRLGELRTDHAARPLVGRHRANTYRVI